MLPRGARSLLLAVPLVLAACAPPPREGMVFYSPPPSWRCALDVGARAAECPCAVPEDLAELRDRPELISVDLHAIEPLDLARLGGLAHLRALRVVALQAFDVAGVARLTQLRELTMTASPDSLAVFTPLRRLEKLVLRRPALAPPAPRVELAPLGALGELRELDLEAVEVGDLAPLSRLGKLERVTLRCGRDVDLSPLRSLGELRQLTLLGEPARDLGVLSSLKSLRVLALGPGYPHGGCSDGVDHDVDAPPAEQRGDNDRGERDGDAPLREQLGGGIEIRHTGGQCLGSICDIDPAACPDGCGERRKLRRGERR